MMLIQFKNFYIKKLLSVDDKKDKLAANNEILHANMPTLNDNLRVELDEV